MYKTEGETQTNIIWTDVPHRQKEICTERKRCRQIRRQKERQTGRKMLFTHTDGETNSQRKSAGERNIGNQDRRGMGGEGRGGMGERMQKDREKP